MGIGCYCYQIVDGQHERGCHLYERVVSPVEIAPQVQKEHRIKLEAALREKDAELKVAREDVIYAAGECLIDIPAPGSDLARILIANRMFMAERDRYKAVADAVMAWHASRWGTPAGKAYQRLEVALKQAGYNLDSSEPTDGT